MAYPQKKEKNEAEKACELCLSTHLDKWNFQHKKVERKNRIWYTDTAYECLPEYEGQNEF